jgi:hypothetical protein
MNIDIDPEQVTSVLIGGEWFPIKATTFCIGPYVYGFKRDVIEGVTRPGDDEYVVLYGPSPFDEYAERSFAFRCFVRTGTGPNDYYVLSGPMSSIQAVRSELPNVNTENGSK